MFLFIRAVVCESWSHQTGIQSVVKVTQLFDITYRYLKIFWTKLFIKITEGLLKLLS